MKPVRFHIEPHSLTLWNKKVQVTSKSIFRVEEAKGVKGCYESVYASHDPVQVIRWYNNTSKPEGWRVRIIKDGDEFVILDKKTF
jgi:hypothetical protein